MTEATLHTEAKAAAKAAEAALRDTWGTPQALYDELNADVLARKIAKVRAQWGEAPPAHLLPTQGFTVDVCAEQWNAKHVNWWGPGSPTAIVDTLTQGPLTGHDWFGNIPFSQLEKWLNWAHHWYSAAARAANALPGIGVMLMPASRTEQKEWQTLIEPFRDKPWVWQQNGFSLETRFLSTKSEKSAFGRTKFVPPSGIKPSSPQFGSVALYWGAL